MCKDESQFRDNIRKYLNAIGKPIDVLEINFAHHVPKMLRAWADQIENEQILVKNATVTIEVDTDPFIQKIELITSREQNQ